MGGLLRRIRQLLWTVGVLVRSGMIAPLRPDRYVHMIAALRRLGVTPMTGVGLAAARRPHGVAIIDERGSLTWGELDRRCDALAAAFQSLDARAGDGSASGPMTVGILCRNHRGLVEALTAVSRAGGDALLLNTGFSAPQLSDVMLREKASILVYDEEFAGLLDPVRTQADDLVEVVAWAGDQTAGDRTAGDRTAGDRTADDLTADVLTVDRLIEKWRGQRPSRPEHPGRIILLTSGTTGTPKGARRSGSGGAPALAAMFDRIPWRAEEPVVVAAPIFHAWGFGQLAIAGTLACTVVMRRRFDPEATLRMVEQHRATGLSVVPVMLERIMELPEAVLDRYDLSSLRFVSASGSRMRPDSVTAFMDRFGDVVCNSYNATEAGLISTATPHDLRAAPDTAGRPVVGTVLRILDDEFREVPVGEVGRIAVLSDSTFEGYTSGDSKDFHGDYMLSGDIGRLDEAGRLYVVGRDDDMIVSGGENVYPLEVEQVLNAHPAVVEACVVGVDDDRFGQRLAAYVVRRPEAEVAPDDLRRHVKEQLAGYKVPRDVTFLAELPRNAAGKIVKRDLDAAPRG